MSRKTASDKVLCEKTFNIRKKTKYDWYQREIASLACKFFDKKSSGSSVKSGIMSNQQLAEELQKPIISKFGKRKKNVKEEKKKWNKILVC